MTKKDIYLIVGASILVVGIGLTAAIAFSGRGKVVENVVATDTSYCRNDTYDTFKKLLKSTNDKYDYISITITNRQLEISDEDNSVLTSVCDLISRTSILKQADMTDDEAKEYIEQFNQALEQLEDIKSRIIGNDVDEQVIVLDDNTNIRTEASIKGDILTTANKGDKIKKISEKDGWTEVEINGETGYIRNGSIADNSDNADKAYLENDNKPKKTEDTPEKPDDETSDKLGFGEDPDKQKEYEDAIGQDPGVPGLPDGFGSGYDSNSLTDNDTLQKQYEEAISQQPVYPGLPQGFGN